MNQAHERGWDALSLRPAVIRRLADTDIDVARAIIAGLNERVVAFVGDHPATGSPASASESRDTCPASRPSRQPGADLVAHVSRQELADAAGAGRPHGGPRGQCVRMNAVNGSPRACSPVIRMSWRGLSALMTRPLPM